MSWLAVFVSSILPVVLLGILMTMDRWQTVRDRTRSRLHLAAFQRKLRHYRQSS
jgi:hypothetical protein